MIVDVMGSGALNLDLIYEVEDLTFLQQQGFDLFPGREISGGHETAERLIELLEAHGEKKAECGGGSSANTIYVLSRLGWKCGFVGACGHDRAGGLVLGSMERVDCSLVKKSGRSGICIVILGKRQRDRAMFVAPSDTEAWPEMDGRVEEYLSGTRLFHLSSLVQDEGIVFQEELCAFLRPDTVLSFDPGEIYAAKGLKKLEKLLSRTDILFITEDEVSNLTGKKWQEGAPDLLASLNREREKKTDLPGITLFRESRGPVLVVKHGKQGASVHFGKESFFFPAKKVENIVDNTGAGDSLNAGFLDGVLKGEGYHVCMKKGIDVATFSLYGFGRSWVNKFDLMGER